MTFSELPDVLPLGPPPKLCSGPNRRVQFKATPFRPSNEMGTPPPTVFSHCS